MSGEQLFIQTKFLKFLAPSFERFKQVDSFLYNCRCPYCGDSTKSKTKARGYFYRNKSGLLAYQCHNCGASRSFKNVLKDFSKGLYDEYIFETFKSKGSEGASPAPTKQPESTVGKEYWTKYLTPVTKLSRIHLATKYLKERQIPESKYKKFWYTENFRAFTDGLNLNLDVPADPRLVLAETDKFGNIKIVIARALKDSPVRYVTVRVDESYPKLFGLSDLDHTKPIHIVEGAIDSLFLDNCIATLDANLFAYKNYDLNLSNVIHIWDNEPRSKHIVDKVKQAIEANEKVVLFPSTITDKDINQMVLSGIDIQSVINKNTFKGIEARMKFSSWRKVQTNAKQKSYYGSSGKRGFYS